MLIASPAPLRAILSRRKQAGSRVTVADSSARPASGLAVPTARPSALRSAPMTTADVLDAPPPASAPATPRRLRARVRPRRHCRAARQRARPELPPDRCVRRRMGAEGLECRRGPRGGRDGGGRRRVDRGGRSRAPGAGGRPALDGSPSPRRWSDGATHLVRLLPLLPGRSAAPAELDCGRDPTSARWWAASVWPCAASFTRRRPDDLVGPAAPPRPGSPRLADRWGPSGASCWAASWSDSPAASSRRCPRFARSSSTTT